MNANDNENTNLNDSKKQKQINSWLLPDPINIKRSVLKDLQLQLID